MKSLADGARGALEELEVLGPISQSAAPGAAVYLVGGWLRDRALGRRPPGTVDVDLAVEGDARAFAARLAERLGGTSFTLHEAQQVYRVVARRAPVQIDVARLQGGDILRDLARRDFTINALALPILPGPGPLLDPHGGLRDLRAKRLRAVSERVFREDPLRMLRAFRLAAQLELAIDGAVLAAIKAHRRRLRACAGERIRCELLQLLSVGASAPWLRRMDETGLLTALFPELERSRRCARVYYGAGGVLKHTLDALERMDFLLGNLPSLYPRLAADIARWLQDSLGDNHAALLRLAVLLHDVAKPACAKRIGGRLRFFGHEARGARMADRILERLRFSQEERRAISTAVAHHLRPGNLAAGGIITDKAVFRFFRDLKEHGVSLLLLCWADHASYLRPAALRRILGKISLDPRDGAPAARTRACTPGKTLYHLQVISFLLERHFLRPQTSRPVKLLDGHAVMKALQLPPGPRVGAILRELLEAQAEGKVKDRRQALDFIRGLKIRETS